MINIIKDNVVIGTAYSILIESKDYVMLNYLVLNTLDNIENVSLTINDDHYEGNLILPKNCKCSLDVEFAMLKLSDDCKMLRVIKKVLE